MQYTGELAQTPSRSFIFVMRGLDPRIHVRFSANIAVWMACSKAGHDEKVTGT
jgi:hypothetical protein